MTNAELEITRPAQTHTTRYFSLSMMRPNTGANTRDIMYGMLMSTPGDKRGYLYLKNSLFGGGRVRTMVLFFTLVGGVRSKTDEREKYGVEEDADDNEHPVTARHFFQMFQDELVADLCHLCSI